MSPQPIDYQVPGSSSRDAAAITCLRCGGTGMTEGTVRIVDRVRFAPKRLGFWRFNRGVKVLAYACLSCGSVTMTLDPDELRRLIEPRKSGNPAAT